MADEAHYLHHIEAYVDSSITPALQVASVNAIAKHVTNDLLTLEALVKEMGMYLTTTDNIIRTRGILLLGELLTQLESKPLEDTVIHSLASFFAERLADWRALRGALVGCVALVKRRINVGTITDTDAEAIAQSFLQNLQVQSLGQFDRKLCFELLECLLDHFPNALISLGDTLMYGICEAIDGEKDPSCLIISFHIIQLLGGIFPDSSGPLANIAEDLFELLGCYFPIHFTHPKNEDVDVKRDELSRALMLAFGSTPLFEPFSIPLLFEKLSSSLPSAKIESFKYLTYCISKYGSKRMEKHIETIWSSIKDTLYISPQFTLPIESDPTGGMEFQESEITKQALLLLHEIIRNNNDSFLNLIVNDKDINIFIDSLTQSQNFNEISMERRQKLHSVGCILTVTASYSVSSCSNFFHILINALENPLKDNSVNFEALYLLVELLDACRSLVVSGPHKLNKIFISVLKESSSNAYVYSSVKGLKCLAMLPEVSKDIYEGILVNLMEIVTLKFDETFLWKSTLFALGQIGLCVESEKLTSFECIVIEKLVSLLGFNDHLTHKLEAIYEIGSTRQSFAMKLMKTMDEIISSNLSELYVHGDSKSVDLTVKLLECYSSKLLPRFLELGGSERIPMSFAYKIWDNIGNTVSFSSTFQANELVNATMEAMKQIIANCSLTSQEIIIEKALRVISSNNNSYNTLTTLTSRDNLITSLFASIIISLHPQTQIPNIKFIFELFISTLNKNHISSAHALGSLVNKLSLSNPSLEEGFYMIFTRLRLSTPIHIIGLSWLGKGLLMRGHELVKEVIITFIRNINNERSMMLYADGFKILMSDSESCLNKKYHAIIRPLYKQRFFTTISPLLISEIVKTKSMMVKYMLYRALTHVVSNTPFTVILNDAKKLVPVLLDCLSIWSKFNANNDLVYDVLLVISGILTDKNGKESVEENVNILVDHVIRLMAHSNMTIIRKTSIQCLVAISKLPYTRIYPLKTQVLRAITNALDDPKRIVRQEAVKCRQAWLIF